MILVDTSVWIDFFASRQLPHVKTLTNVIERRDDLCLCGIILTEILQGIKNPKEFQKINTILES